MAIGLRAVTSRQVAYFLAWFHKELVVFRSSFFGSRLAAARSIRDEIARGMPPSRIIAGWAGGPS